MIVTNSYSQYRYMLVIAWTILCWNTSANVVCVAWPGHNCVRFTTIMSMPFIDFNLSAVYRLGVLLVFCCLQFIFTHQVLNINYCSFSLCITNRPIWLTNLKETSFWTTSNEPRCILYFVILPLSTPFAATSCINMVDQLNLFFCKLKAVKLMQ